MRKLIHCINCDKVYLRTPFDRLPEYSTERVAWPDGPKEIERDDFKEFMRQHRGHQLENLRIIDDSWVSEKPYAEPVKISYIKATNGKEDFLIKRFRNRIDEPLQYELIRGDYSLRCAGLEIESEAIQKQLEREINPPLSREQVTGFVRLFQHVAEQLDVSTLERIPEESPYPLEIYYKLDDVSLMYLLRNCRNLFEEKTYPQIEAFIRRHKDDGVLLLKATYRIEISERKELARREAAAVPRLKKASAKS